MTREDLLPFDFWSEENYAGYCVSRTDNYELLCRENDQGTSIHCHNGEAFRVYLAEGKLKKKRYKKADGNLTLTTDVIMTETRLSYMNDDLGYHSLHNLGDNRSMSLHLYVGPIDKCSVDKEEKNKFVFKELEYYSINKTILSN